MPVADPFDVAAAAEAARRYLARREHSRLELTHKLQVKGFCADAIDAALVELIQAGQQSDARFAEALVRDRIARGKGPRILRRDLNQRGVSERLAARALLEAEVDWNALALSVRCGKFGDCLPDDYPEKARQMRFLERRGFEMDQIRYAVAD